MKKQSKTILLTYLRYFIVLLFGLGNSYLLYTFLSPLTIYATSSILSLFTEVLVIGELIYFKRTIIEIARACVIPSAFYLLFTLVFTTRDLNPLKRLKALGLSFLILFTLNLARVLLLSQFVHLNSFYSIHWVFWNVISIFFVVGAWLITVRVLNIKSIPFYSDFLYFYKLISSSKYFKRQKDNHKAKKKRSKKDR